MYNVIYLYCYEASVFITGIVLLLNHKGSVREKMKDLAFRYYKQKSSM